MCFPRWLERHFWVDMVHLWTKNARRFGEQDPYASFGRFGKQGMESLSMIKCF